MKQLKLFGITLAIMSGFLAGAQTPEDLSIGTSYMTLNNIFFDPMNSAAEKAAVDAGASYFVVDARLDVANQISGVENLIARGVSAIVLNPVDSNAIAPAVLSANEAGIPVVTVDVASTEGEVVSHITSDNVEAGRLAGDFVTNQIDSGQIGIVDGPPISTFQQRVDGFREAVQSAGMEVSAHLNALTNSPEAFIDITENMITRNPSLKYIFTVNDVAAMSALAAIQAAGRDDVFVVSVDGAPDVVDLISQGSAIKATVGQQPAEMGRLAVETALAQVRGEKVEKLIYAPLELVTQENASSFSW